MVVKKNKELILTYLKAFYPNSVSLDELSELTKIRKDNLCHYYKKDSYQLIEEIEGNKKDILESSNWRTKECKLNWIKQDIESNKILVYEHFTWNKSRETIYGKSIQTKHIKLSPHYYNEILNSKIS